MEAGADAVGFNCSLTSEQMLVLVREIGSQIEAPLIAQPNAGQPRLIGDDVVYDATPQEMASYARRFVDLGARIVGGCCGSTPEHITAIAQAVRPM